MIQPYHVEGFGTYHLCTEHADAKNLVSVPGSTPTDGTCDACAKKGFDYAYPLVHKRKAALR